MIAVPEVQMASAAKEQQILRAAERLFTSRRFHEVTLDDVARTARVGKGTIYRYFQNKDDLFLRVAASGHDELRALIERIAAEPLPFEEQLRSMLHEISRLHLRKHALFRLIHHDASRMPFVFGPMREHGKRHHREVHAQLTAWLRRSAQAGHVRKELAPEALTACLMGMLRGYLMYSTRRSTKAPPLDDLIGLFLRGVSTKRRKP